MLWGSIDSVGNADGKPTSLRLEKGMAVQLPFRDRSAAGEQLAQAIAAELAQSVESQTACHPIVYALPRGGLPVAEPVARQLNCPLDLIVAKKITRPDNPELAIGAVTADGCVLWGPQQRAGRNQIELRAAALQQAQKKAKMQLEQLTAGRPQVNPDGAIAILVDDGMATGMTMAVAAMSLRDRDLSGSFPPAPAKQSLREKKQSSHTDNTLPKFQLQRPAAIWICAPVAPSGLAQSLGRWCDRAIILATPDPFLSVSRFYKEFPQIEIEEALTCLQQYKWE